MSPAEPGRLETRPLRRRTDADSDGVRPTPISEAFSSPSAERAPVEDAPVRDLRLVRPRRPERPDYTQQRRAFQERCGQVAEMLARTRRFEDRLELYRQGIFTRHELSTAAALYPELMPTLNGEWEWIALTLADNLDDD